MLHRPSRRTRPDTRAVTLAAVGLAWLIPSQVHSVQKPESLKDLARRNGGTVVMSGDVDYAYAPFSDVVGRADVVVRAWLRQKESRLTNDEQFVRTYFTFVPTRIFKDVVGIEPSRTTPQMTIPLVFFEPGGLVHTDGLQIIQRWNDSADPPLGIGDDLFLFLEWDSAENAFRLQDGKFGLLRIQGLSVVEANKVMKPRFAGRSVSDVEREIDKLVTEIRIGQALPTGRFARSRAPAADGRGAPAAYRDD